MSSNPADEVARHAVKYILAITWELYMSVRWQHVVQPRQGVARHAVNYAVVVTL